MIEKLGEGSAGIVWKVRYKPTGRIMAKKACINTKTRCMCVNECTAIIIDAEPLKRRQIIRELSFLKTCESPYIVSFYGAFLNDKEATVSICMEYCEGGSFEDIYKRARDLHFKIGEHVLASLADSVCQALIYLHSKKVIHRDIKPSNILVCKGGEIKLCDLGVSGELIDSIADTFTGSQYYMAPERIQGSAYSVKSDIWSLGLTIIEVAQTKPALPPSDHPHLSVFELLDFIVSQPLPNLGPERSEEIRDFISRCLIKSPQERPGPAEMLKHPFLRVSKRTNSSWIREIWHW
ncbi:kinase-like domain-containing protein, partial [Dichotomocladium elegans]